MILTFILKQPSAAHSLFGAFADPFNRHQTPQFIFLPLPPFKPPHPLPLFNSLPFIYILLLVPGPVRADSKFFHWLKSVLWPVDIVFMNPSWTGGTVIKSVLRLITLSAHYIHWTLRATGWQKTCPSCDGNHRIFPSYMRELELWSCSMTRLHNGSDVRNLLK